MRSILSIAWLLISAPVALAQNLVPNGSFEEYSACPDSGNQMDRAIGWSAYRGSPDYFNACDIVSFMGVPTNWIGDHYAAEGVGYAGAIVWEGAVQFREHFGAPLNEPLVPDVPVFISFKAVPAVRGIQQDCRWSIEGFGVRFTMATYLENNNAPLPNDAALYATDALLDTTNWTTVSGMYVPDSAYQFIVVGGFFDDDVLTPVNFNPEGNIDRAYVFIDEVCVSYDPADCGLGMGVLDMSHPRVKSYPNPFTDVLNVSLTGFGDAGSQVYLYDTLGRVVWSGRTEPGQSTFTIEGNSILEGAYLLSVRTMNMVLSTNVVVRVSP